MDPLYKEYKKKYTKKKQSDCKTLKEVGKAGCRDEKYEEYNEDATVHKQADCINKKPASCTFNHDFYTTGSLMRSIKQDRDAITMTSESTLTKEEKEEKIRTLSQSLTDNCDKVNNWRVEIQNGCRCSRKTGLLSPLICLLYTSPSPRD